MFSDILRQTFDSLTLLYLNVYPSYRRTEQYRLDITVILYTVYELMFHVCSSSSQMLDLESVALEQPYLTIHSCCCKLLATLTIVGSPLADLYKVYKRGYQRRSKRRRQTSESGEDDSGYYSQWLSWVQPDIIPKGVTSVSDMQTTTALYIQIKLLLAQPEPLWSMLIQLYESAVRSAVRVSCTSQLYESAVRVSCTSQLYESAVRVSCTSQLYESAVRSADESLYEFSCISQLYESTV
ncbi:KIAA0825 [Bugula neritina]|uniref:KIAA0825 n=1 Tax=Bugula neritina TaxID=10212 RepID=A0A7J7K8F6_BUGNE|nr:KIAA0825 [Bugula neritina]